MDNYHSVSKKLNLGVFWLLILQLVIKFISIVSTLILVRVLSPEDFGLVALSMSFYALIELMTAFGFDAAIIQIKNVSDKHYSTVWTFRLLVSFVLTTLVYASAPFIADFYDEPKLVFLTEIISFLFIFKALSNPGIIKISKEMDFKKEFNYKALIKISAFVFTISAAVILKNYYALIIGMYASVITSVFMSYRISSFRPFFCMEHLKEIFSFSKWMIVNAWLNFLNTRTTEIVLGYLGTPASVGLFNVSQEIAAMPTSEFGAAINRSSYSGYSMVKDELDSFRKLFYGVLEKTALFVIPSGVGIFFIAHEISNGVLGPGWTETQRAIEYIALGSVFNGLTTNNQYVYMALGRPKLTTMLSSIRVVLFFLFLIPLTKMYGLEGSALAFLLTSIFYYPVPLILTKNLLSLDFLVYINRIKYVVISTVFMAAFFIAFGDVINSFESYILVLFLKALMGFTSFSLAIIGMWFFRGKPVTCLEGQLYKYFLNRIKVKY